MTDILAQYDINTKDLKEEMALIQPSVQALFRIDYAAMHPFFPTEDHITNFFFM